MSRSIDSSNLPSPYDPEASSSIINAYIPQRRVDGSVSVPSYQILPRCLDPRCKTYSSNESPPCLAAVPAPLESTLSGPPSNSLIETPGDSEEPQLTSPRSPTSENHVSVLRNGVIRRQNAKKPLYKCPDAPVIFSSRSAERKSVFV